MPRKEVKENMESRWRVMNTAERFFTVIISGFLAGGFITLILNALSGILGFS